MNKNELSLEKITLNKIRLEIERLEINGSDKQKLRQRINTLIKAISAGITIIGLAEKTNILQVLVELISKIKK